MPDPTGNPHPKPKPQPALEVAKDWIASKGKYAHAVAGAAVILIAGYHEVPVFHDLVNSYFNLLPASAKAVITAGTAVYMWYKNNQK